MIPVLTEEQFAEIPVYIKHKQNFVISIDGILELVEEH